ncbi:chemotaxis protein [Clostridium botulinum]|nr:chemotaxis protein [Clostridium botulinum]NFR13757.1 chemotaxis protein [Clostridium botulinum]NFR42176.1 chemotaxis protein [Clostridium botulinum]NFS50616.1 chemotaxis protein [Clostridium botulinum]
MKNTNLSNVKLTDVINVNTLQKILDAFSDTTGISTLAVDLEGPVTKMTKPSRFCMNLTRGTSEGLKRCNECDIQGGLKSGKFKKPAAYYCHAGLMDFAAPILIGDIQIGSLVGGQVLPEPPKEDKIRLVAKEIGVNEDEYINAVRDIRVLSKESIEAAANLLFIIANTLSDVGYQKYIGNDLTKKLFEVSHNIYERITEVENYVNKVNEINSILVNRFNTLIVSADVSATQVEEIDQVAKYINNVSSQTNLLGLNASIEASRAREYGAGFSVIAQEIRKLSNMNSEQSKKIGTVLHTVKDSIFNMSDQIKDTNENVNENVEALNQIINSIFDLRQDAELLETFGHKLSDLNSND